MKKRKKSFRRWGKKRHVALCEKINSLKRRENLPNETFIDLKTSRSIAGNKVVAGVISPAKFRRGGDCACRAFSKGAFQSQSRLTQNVGVIYFRMEPRLRVHLRPPPQTFHKYTRRAQHRRVKRRRKLIKGVYF